MDWLVYKWNEAGIGFYTNGLGATASEDFVFMRVEGEDAIKLLQSKAEGTPFQVSHAEADSPVSLFSVSRHESQFCA